MLKNVNDKSFFLIYIYIKEAEWRRVKNFVVFLQSGQPNLF